MVIGGSATGGVEVVNGIDGLESYLAIGAQFSPTSPGVPLSYTLRNLKDNSLFKLALQAEYSIPECENLVVFKDQTMQQCGAGVIEISKELPKDMVITGIGATVTDNNFVGVKVEGRQLFKNGTIGVRQTYEVGDLNAIETWSSVPDGYAVTSYAAGVFDSNIEIQRIGYRKLVWDKNKWGVTGPTLYRYSGYNPNGTIELSCEVSTPNSVMSGISLGCHDSNMAILQVFSGDF